MDIIYSDDNVTVQADDLVLSGYRYSQGVYKVTSKRFRGRTFKGESAWSDAQRYVNDQLVLLGERPYLYL